MPRRATGVWAMGGLAACLSLWACGRLNFDPLAGDAGPVMDASELVGDASAVDADLAPAWVELSYIKASNAARDDEFGRALAISADGTTLAISAYAEASNAVGIGGNQGNNSASGAGAVYIFKREGEQWLQQAYVKASNTETDDRFGAALSLNASGTVMVVGAPLEDSALKLDGSDNMATDSGAVYVFRSADQGWSQEAYIKPNNGESRDLFGSSVAISGNGEVVAIGAPLEDSAESGVMGLGNVNGRDASGAVYIFELEAGPTWTERAYLKASTSTVGARFGSALAIDNNGSTVAVAAENESSNATGVDGDDANTMAPNAGAVFVFASEQPGWTQTGYLKANNASADDHFGNSLDLSDNGAVLAVGAVLEDSDATTVDGDASNDLSLGSGAVYVYNLTDGPWKFSSYIKAFNSDAGDEFGSSVALDSEGLTLAVSARLEDSAANTVNGNGDDNTASNSGSVYVYGDTGEGWKRKDYLKASNSGANDLFGYQLSMSASGRRLVVAATQEASLGSNPTDDSAPGAGAAYNFEF